MTTDYEDAAGLARELVAIDLIDDEDDEDALTDRIAEIVDDGHAGNVIEVLVYALASTWDNLDDFSEHIVAALAEAEA